jgi:hypothetical protein
MSEDINVRYGIFMEKLKNESSTPAPTKAEEAEETEKQLLSFMGTLRQTALGKTQDRLYNIKRKIHAYSIETDIGAKMVLAEEICKIELSLTGVCELYQFLEKEPSCEEDK